MKSDGLMSFEKALFFRFTKNVMVTELEYEKNKSISKVNYIVEPYLGISHLDDFCERASFATIAKKNIDILKTGGRKH